MDKHFDDKIRQALEKLETQQDVGAWEAFEQRLEQDAIANENSFDDLVSKKLNHLEVPVSQGDWGLFEKMIDAEETAEQLQNEAIVDNLVADKLENFRVAYQPHHWQMMAKRLEEEFFIRYHLIRCKSAEVGLVLLMLLTFSRLAFFMDDAAKMTFPASQPIAQEHGKKSPATSSTYIFTKPTVNTKGLQSKRNKGNHAISSIGSSDNPATVPTTKANEETPVNGEGPNELLLSIANINRLPSLGIGTANPDSDAKNLVEARASEKLQEGLIAAALNKPTEQLALADARPIQSKYAWESLQLPKSIFEKEKQLRFAIFTNTDLAYVVTPPSKYSVFDTLVATGPDTTLASGYGGGITVSWKKGKWEMLTGGIYTFKRYIPNTPVFLFETVNYYIREEFNGVQLDLLQVPLNFNYHLKDQGKWRFYGSFGASGHFITSSVYEIATSRTPSFSSFARMPMPDGLPADDDSISDEKELPNGLFDGGDLRENFFLTANVGLGMERYVSSRWSVYFQPNYQHHVLTNGIGVNGEKLYNFSFQLGTKVNLK